MRHLAAQAEEPENCILAPVRNRQVGPDAPLDGLVAEAPGAVLPEIRRDWPRCSRCGADRFPRAPFRGLANRYAKEERTALFQHMLQARAYVIVLGVTLPAY